MSEELHLDTAAVRWSVPADERGERPLIVLLHGYGADEHDLFGLIPHLPEDFVYAAVRAPLDMPWPQSGAAWYPITDLAADDSAPITAGAQALLSWLQSEGLTAAGFLGFSQGGATALQAMRLDRTSARFIVCLAGYAAPGELAGDASLAADPLPVFWGRGTADAVIPAARIEHTTSWLPAHSDLSGRVYSGLAHGISFDELTDVSAFLRKQL